MEPLDDHCEILSLKFIPEKLVYLDTLEQLRSASQTCFTRGYERGAVECVNMMIRSCCNANDLHFLLKVYKLICAIYIQLRQYENAIKALEKIRDLAVETDDYAECVETYQTIAWCHVKENRNKIALGFL